MNKKNACLVLLIILLIFGTLLILVESQVRWGFLLFGVSALAMVCILPKGT